MISADSGEISLGFNTIVQPAASAGATLQITWLTGKFHGVISAQTPIGSFATIVLPRSVSNAKFFRTLIVSCRCAGPLGKWTFRAAVIGTPISSDIAWA